MAKSPRHAAAGKERGEAGLTALNTLNGGGCNPLNIRGNSGKQHRCHM